MFCKFHRFAKCSVIIPVTVYTDFNADRVTVCNPVFALAVTTVPSVEFIVIIYLQNLRIVNKKVCRCVSVTAVKIVKVCVCIDAFASVSGIVNYDTGF